MTGLRLSAGLALLGTLYAGVVPDAGTLDMPVAVIGGSALTGFVPNRDTAGRSLVFDIAARAEEAQPPVVPLGRGEAVLDLDPAPTFTRIEINGEGRIRFEGRGAPGTRVTLNRQGRPFGSAAVTPRGDWELSVERGLTAGEHLFSAVSSQPGSGVTVFGGDVRIAIPSDFAATLARPPALSGGTAGVDSAIDRLPATPGTKPAEGTGGKIGQAESKAPREGPAAKGKDTPSPARPVEIGARDTSTDSGPWFWLQEWLAKSNREFQGRIVRNLQTPAPSAGEKDMAAAEQTSEADRAKSLAAAKSETEAAERAKAERIAAERAAAEKRHIEDERRAAAAADARDAEAARTVEAQRRAAEAAQSKRFADAAAKARAEEELRAAEARERMMKAAEEEARRLKALIEADAPRAIDTARGKIDREERERLEKALLEAEIAGKRQRAEAKARQAEAEAKARQAEADARRKSNEERVPQVRKVEPGERAKPSGKELSSEVAKAPAAPVPTRRPETAAKAVVPPAAMTPPARREVPVPTPRRDSVAKAPGLRGGDGAGDVGSRDRPQPQPGSSPRAVGTRPDGGMVLGAETRTPPSVAGQSRSVATTGCRDAGRLITPPGTYVVRRGDSLWLISRRHYRRGALWPVIHRANDDKIDDPDLIFPCQRFFLPERPR